MKINALQELEWKKAGVVITPTPYTVRLTKDLDFIDVIQVEGFNFRRAADFYRAILLNFQLVDKWNVHGHDDRIKGVGEYLITPTPLIEPIRLILSLM